ncbi:microtubule-associated protein futsch-like isoform X1 [Vespula pensylvanica]|uniref:Peptidase S1 domain-containing protein n=1 Tax=Vespula pensylvanica TaxID=30213 RepID=A0A834KNJ4_VESPE|nr:microtubule-associated protein futsch-like isoform X1 [Vespula pensylvanica]KAF7409182.1 hypothetical protein H0235_014034 [Vespula pensylvanica]
MSEIGGDDGTGGESGMDNLAFAIEDECVNSSEHVENNVHEQQSNKQQVSMEQDYRSPADTIGSPTENGHRRSFVSQHYVEPVRNSPEPRYKSETKIELPPSTGGQTPDKNSTSEPKLNGVHGNGNNNDASFLNSSATSVQVNDNGKKEQIEAVNLELVSMRPYTGNNIQTKGQEACEVPADPYEEYFVPVNEHRKYISRGPEAEVETTVAGVRFDLGPGVGREGLSLRDPAAGLVDYSHWLTALRGEKLYVTKDKRSRSSYWRRMACWGCGLLVLSIAIIIAILAATGVILTQEATEPLDTIDQTNSRQFDGAQLAGSQEYMKNPPTSPAPETSSFPPWPTTDETLYQIVPDALDGVLKLDDFVWDEQMSDAKSRVYRELASEIEEYLQNMLQSNTRDSPVIKVYDINKDSEVKFRISHPLWATPKETQENIEKAVRENGNSIGRYHLGRLQVGELVDQCQDGSLGCAETCKYDYSQGLFVCSCTSGKMLNTNGKDCLDENDLSNIDMDDMILSSSTESIKDFVGRSRGPGMMYEPGNPNSWDHSDFVTNSMNTQSSSNADVEPTVQSINQDEEILNKNINNAPNPVAEPTADPEISRAHNSDISNWMHEYSKHPIEEHSVEPESSVEAEPSAELEPSIEPKATAELETTAEPEPASTPEPAVKPEPASTSESAAEPEPSLAPEPAAEPEPSSAPEPAAEPEPSSAPEPAAEPEPSSTSEPAAEPEPSSAPEPAAEPEPSSAPEPAVEPEPSSAPEPTAEPEPSSAPEPTAEPEPSSAPEPATEPEPSSAPEPAAEPEPSFAPEPAAEPEPSFAPEPTAKPEPSSAPEPVTEPEPTAKPEPAAEPESPIEEESSIKAESTSTTEPELLTELPPQLEPSTELSSQAELSTEPSLLSEPSTKPIHELPVIPEHSSEENTSTKFEPSSEFSLEERPIEMTTQENVNLPSEESKLSMEVDTSTEIPLHSVNDVESTTLIMEPSSSITLIESKDVTQPPIETDVAMTTGVAQEYPQSSAEVEHSTMPEILVKTNSESETTPKTPIEFTAKSEFSYDSELRNFNTNINANADEIDNDESLAVIPLQTNNEESTTETYSEQATMMLQEHNLEEKEPPVVTESITTLPVTMTTINNKKGIEETTFPIKQFEENEITELPINSDVDISDTTVPTVQFEETTLNIEVDPTRTLKSDSETIIPEMITNSETSSETPKSMLETNTESNQVLMKSIDSAGIEVVSNLTDKSEESYSSKNHSIKSLDIPETNEQDINEPNVIEHAPKSIFSSLPKEFSQNVEPLLESVNNQTDEEHVMLLPKEEDKKDEQDTHAIIPQLIPEQITHFTTKPEESTMHQENVLKVNDQAVEKKNLTINTILDRSTEHPEENVVSIGETIDHSTNHPLHPAIFPESIANHVEKMDPNEERHFEDMSPFLPDVQKEKETSKKAPRLDKDEQDVPNPFETHVEDVIINKPERKDSRHELMYHANKNDSEKNLSDLDNYNINVKADDNDVSIIPQVINETEIEMVNPLQQNELLRESEDEILKETLNNTRTLVTNDLSDDTTNNTFGIKNEKDEQDDEILRVVPLDEHKETKNMEYELDKVESTTEVAQITTMMFTKENEKSIDELTVNNNIISSSEKPEENVVEDQYNDINDETLSKTFDRNNNVKIGSAEVTDDKSKKLIINNIDEQQDNIKSISDSEESQSTTEKILSTETEMPSSMSSPSLDKHAEDAKITTQVPVLPMEIQQDLSTTELIDKIEATTIADDNSLSDNHTESSNIVHDDKEKESVTMIPSTIAPMYSLETKTTAQVPILPDELQTTEHEFLVTTSSVRPDFIKEIDDTKHNHNRSATTMISIEYINNISVTTVSSTMAAEVDNSTNVVIETDNTNLTETIPTEHDNIQHTVLNEEPNKLMNLMTTLENTTNYPKQETAFSNEDYVAIATEISSTKVSDPITTSEDIRPVTEEILDDTRPYNFDFRSLFSTTTMRDVILNEDSKELSEEELKVIPLEKSQEIKKKSTEKKNPDKYKYKKEKELNLENQRIENVTTEINDPTILISTEIPKILVESNENITTENIPNSSTDSIISKFILADTEGNIVPIPKLNIVEITSRSNQSELEDDKQAHEKNTTIVSLIKNNTEVEANNKYPNYIPVSEEIIESNPVTEPFILIRNYTLHQTTPLIPIFEVEQATIQSNIPIEHDDVLNNSNETLQSNVQKVDNLTASTLNLLSLNTMSYSKCSTGQFQCTNGTSRSGAYCVSLSAKCDSEKDCSDGSDELNCQEEGCPGNFQCANRQCLKRHLVCNGIVDCDDGSDEQNCQDWKCIFDEHRCTNGRCIPLLWLCDGRPDCENHQDEFNCAESCGNDEYLCPMDKRCIPQTWRCNGSPDCANGEDEKLCDCSLNQFKCHTGGCVSKEEICDGIEHCPDRSDEWDCFSNYSFDQKNHTEINQEENQEDKSTNQLNHRDSLLKIRHSDEEYRLVCSDGWSKEFSDSYCRSLGYASSQTTDFKAWDRNHQIVRLKTNPNHRTSLVSNLQRVEFCVSEKIVEVTCEEFSCDTHHVDRTIARSEGETTDSLIQWPSVVILKEEEHGITCTASILGPMHALTSYSCVYKYRQSDGWKLFTDESLFRSNPVKTIIPYTQVKYNQFFYDNDIALIELKEPLIFSKNVSAVCLPTYPIQPNDVCVSVGWRFPVNGELDLQQYNEFLPMPMYDSNECNTTSHYAGFITKYNICVGLSNIDKELCYNDEGAPLMCESESGSWKIQGLLSHHNKCSRGHPAIYSSLEPALDWLRHLVPALQT